ncbi:MAG: hypothetical protein HY369_01340 [Candidatus Aenigmarchaeota archaeon]|nr:hypothetical protein [Candidatus Aenigmarchaeota archaeon]
MRSLTIIILCTLTACFAKNGEFEEVTAEQSDILHEQATVADLVYTPSQHGSAGRGAFVQTSEGGARLYQNIEITIPERYAIVFACEHGKFIVENDQAKAHELWTRLREDQEVTIQYREEYRVTAKVTYQDGTETARQEVRRELVGYDFLDAD